MAASSAGIGDADTTEFAYVGRTALSAIGHATGASYRFAHPGARVHVDKRDAASLEQVPVLRRV
jgi:hypothetical protein